MPHPSGLLVTGTDTGVGKSVIASGLIRLLRDRGVGAVGVKPIETGVPGMNTRWPADADSAQPADALLLREAADNELDLTAVLPDAYAEPLAPMVAAERMGIAVDVPAILAAVRAVGERVPALIVEGAGGIAVPLDRTHDYADVARELDLAVLIVARPALGTINHTLLTVRYAQQRDLSVVGFVVNAYPPEPTVAEQTNPDVIARLAGVPCLGVVPRATGGVADSHAAADLCRDRLDLDAIIAACGW